MDDKKDRSGSGTPARFAGDVQALGLLNKIPAALVLDHIPVKLPAVQAPSLEGLTAELSPRPITQDDLLDRLAELVRQHAQRRGRADGELVGLGDAVVLDTLGSVGGKLLPFSIRENWTVLVNPDPLLPGFFEALVGSTVGLSMEISLTLPGNYPIEALRGATARFLVDVKEAYELELPDPQSPEFLAAVGRGATLTELMQQLAADLAQERTDEAARAARDKVLEVLVERAGVEVSRALVDEEIRRRWAESERPILERKNFEADELQQALNAWQTDPLTRADATRRLKLSLVLAAIAQRDQLQPQREAMDAIVGLLTGPAKLQGEQLKEVFQSAEAQERLTNVLMQLAAIDHVMSKVKFTAPPP